MKRRFKMTCFAIAAGSVILAVQPATASYLEIDVGRTFVYDLNDAGKVGGGGNDAITGAPKNFWWTEIDGAVQLSNYNVKTMLNNNDQIVYLDKVYEDGVEHLLPGFYSFRDRRAEGINNNGVVVGWAVQGNTYEHGVTWQKDATGEYVMTDLGALGTRSRANWINDHGVAVGWSDVGAVERAVVWEANNNIRDLGTLRADGTGKAELLR